MQKILFIVLAGISLLGCENTEIKTRRFSAYYDVDSLIDSQLRLLAGTAVEMNKFAVLNGDEDSARYEADSLVLAQELNAFRKANINKPTNEGLYNATVTTKNSLRQVEYLPVEEDSDLEVQYLQLSFKDNQLIRMEAQVVEAHWLFKSDRILTLMLNEEPSFSHINYYKIKGSQKMIFKEKVDFIVEGSIIPSALPAR